MRRLPAILVVLVACLFLGWWIVRVGLVATMARSRPIAAYRIAPNEPAVIEALIELELRNRMGIVGPAAKAAAREALRRAPLMDEPFLIGGIDRLVIKDNRGAKSFLSHALARNGRSRLSRLLMLEVELRMKDAQGAASNMTILSRLLPEVEKVFVPELARLAQDRQTRDTLRQTLRSDPRILASVLQLLAAKGAKPELILHLAAGAPGMADPNSADWRGALLDSMVAKGDVVRARQLWVAFSGLKPEVAGATVYDGDFAGLPGLAPFNWNFSASEMGAAERDRKGGLQVEYYGRTKGELASQLLTLAPGQYRLSFNAEGDLDTPQHRLIWRILCENPNSTLLELPLAKITYAGRRLAGTFTVPAACKVQWLRLVGEPTEFPKIENVLIRNLRIDRIGGTS